MTTEGYENILSRRSVKGYLDKEVPVEMMEKIVEAGQAAPSGMNKQPTAFIAVQNKELRDELSRMNAAVLAGNNPAYNADPFYGAPAVIAVLANPERPTYLYDGSLAMENLLLAAHSMGLGACWIHRCKEVFETEEGKEILRKLEIPETYEGIGFAIVGYPAREPVPASARTSLVRMVL
ncbi:MAG: nitroreductase [Erysipelotrichaceae bacterium]|nr:nitroreductase [Erysipelotrichaceae bacterium]